MNERTVSQAIARQQIFSVMPQDSAYDAACLMTKGRCGSVLVIDTFGEMRGIFTERDLMVKVIAKGLDPRTTPMTDVMTSQPRAVRPETRVSDAVMLMKGCGFRHLPVVSRASGVVGVFSLRDAMPDELQNADCLVEHLEDEFANVLV